MFISYTHLQVVGAHDGDVYERRNECAIFRHAFTTGFNVDLLLCAFKECGGAWDLNTGC